MHPDMLYQMSAMQQRELREYAQERRLARELRRRRQAERANARPATRRRSRRWRAADEQPVATTA